MADQRMFFEFVYRTIVLRPQILCSMRGRMCQELKVMFNALALCLRRATNLDELFVYPGGNSLVERVLPEPGTTSCMC